MSIVYTSEYLEQKLKSELDAKVVVRIAYLCYFDSRCP